MAREMDGCLDSALHVLQELRIRLAQTGDDLDAEFNHVRRILTPTQAAKFLVWVARNKACTHMLNELWERVYNAPTPSVPTAAASTTTSTTTTTTENAPSKPHALSQPPKLRQGSFASQTTSSGGDEDEEEEEDDDDEDDGTAPLPCRWMDGRSFACSFVRLPPTNPPPCVWEFRPV